MSEHAQTHSHSQEPGEGHGLVQEPEDIDMGPSMGILVGSLLAFAAVVVWAAIILHMNFVEILPNGWPKAPVEIGRAEIGIVNQKMFVVDRRVERHAEQAQAELNSYGWVDQKQGQVHIPIEQAMKALLAEQPE